MTRRQALLLLLPGAVALQPLHWVLGSRVLLSAPSLMTRRQVLLLLLPGAVALQPLHGF